MVCDAPTTSRSPVAAQTNLPSGGDQARLGRREPRGQLRLGRGQCDDFENIPTGGGLTGRLMATVQQ